MRPRIHAVRASNPPTRETDIGRHGRERGAVLVEFLIAFPPLCLFFLCLLQLGLLLAMRLMTDHAAMTAARAAAVVLADDPKNYDNEPAHQASPDGTRLAAIRHAAVLALAPYIINGAVQKVVLLLPAGSEPGGADAGEHTYEPITSGSIEKVRVRLEVTVACKIPLANRVLCPPSLRGSSVSWLELLMSNRVLTAEAVFPYQGAAYRYVE